MEMDRNSLYVGLLTKTSTFTLAYPRKVLFKYDIIGESGYDVLNNMEYNVQKKWKSKGYYISCVKSLDKILESLGYPEQLEDVHIQRIMEEDFGKIFVDSTIMHSLYSQSMDRLTEIYTQRDFKVLKHEFIITEDEEKERRKENKQMIKRRWF